jgi:hypothetical protein
MNIPRGTSMKNPNSKIKRITITLRGSKLEHVIQVIYQLIYISSNIIEDAYIRYIPTQELG